MKTGPNWCYRCSLPLVGMHGTGCANCRCTEPQLRPSRVEPYGIGVDGPEIGQGIDAPWLDDDPEPDSERTRRADHQRDEDKDPEGSPAKLYRGWRLDRY